MKCFALALCVLAGCAAAAAAPQFNNYQAQAQAQARAQQFQPFQQQKQFQAQPAPARSSASSSGNTVNIALTRSSPDEPIIILKQVQDFTLPGSFSWSYETENGIQAYESGELKNAGSQDEANAVQGSYSFTADDGVLYTVNYIADENGFRAEGAHLPVPPPVPEEIQRAIDYARSQPGFREDDDGQYKKEDN